MNRLSVIELNRLTHLARQIRQLYATTEQLAQQAQAKCNEAVAEALLLGQALNEAKKLVGHGNWLKWIAENCPTVCERTARNYMRLANRQHVADLENTASLRQAYITTGIIPPRPAPRKHVPLPSPNQNLPEQQTEPTPPTHSQVQPAEAAVAEVLLSDPIEPVRSTAILLLNILSGLPDDLKPRAAVEIEPLASFWREQSPSQY